MRALSPHYNPVASATWARGWSAGDRGRPATPVCGLHGRVLPTVHGAHHDLLRKREREAAMECVGGLFAKCLCSCV